MPEPGYADNPPGCFHLLLGLVVILVAVLIFRSCL